MTTIPSKNSARLTQAVMLFILAVSMIVRYLVLNGFDEMYEAVWLFMLCGIFMIYSYKVRKSSHHFFAADAACLLPSAILCISTYASFFDNSPDFNAFPVNLIVIGLSFLTWYIFFCCLRAFEVRFITYPCVERKLSPSQRFAFVLGCIIVLAVTYSCFWPYLQSPDTQNQWMQIHGDLAYNNIHAIGHTIFLKALLSIWDSYTFVVLVQLVGLIAVNTAFAEFFYSKGIRFDVIVFVQLLSLIWLSAHTIAFFAPWKDCPAALCMAVVVLIMMKHPQPEKMSYSSAACLGLVLVWCALFRLNGIIVLIVCGLYFLFAFFRAHDGRKIAAFLVPIVLSWAFVSCYSTYVLHTEKLENGFSIQVFGSGIAAAVKGGNLSDEELAAVYELLPISWMEETYTGPAYKQDLIWASDGSPRIAGNKNLEIFHNEFVLRLGEQKSEVIRLYLRLLPHHFGVMLKDALGSAAMTWRFDTPFFVASYIFSFSLILFYVLRYRLVLSEMLVFLPTLCNTFSIIISTITNETRYLLPSFIMAPFFILYILWRGKLHESNAAL